MTKPKTILTTPARTARLLPATLLIGLLGFLGVPAALAQVCGDVNSDDDVTTTDALLVLKKAVDQPVNLVCSGECAALQERVAELETLLEHLSIKGNNLVLTGQNFQVVSGTGETDGVTNGKGNVIIGYDESNDNNSESNEDDKTGSHNLVIGRFHSYPSYGGIVAGEDNEISGIVASVLGGAENSADGEGAVVIGGQNNQADEETSVVVAGEENRANGRSCSIAGGSQNQCTGQRSAVSGGANNFVSGAGSTISGTTNRTLGSNFGWVAGNLTQF